jgi:N utilization substance protein B
VGKRTRSREIALQVLYQVEMSGGDADEAVDLFWRHFNPSPELQEFSRRIVAGVRAHRNKIDAIIESFSEHWRLDRITIVDRSILRLAIFELLMCPDIPTKVVINEAVELGKRFGSDQSGSFVNGMLDSIARQLTRPAPAEEPQPR